MVDVKVEISFDNSVLGSLLQLQADTRFDLLEVDINERTRKGKAVISVDGKIYIIYYDKDEGMWECV